MKYSVIIAARTGSHRLPAKALLPLKEIPMIVFLIRRLLDTKRANQIVFATTDLEEDNDLAALVEKEGIPVFRGENEDVVNRFVDAADRFQMEYVVRVTGDCPFTDAETLDYCLEKCEEFGEFDLATTKSLFPVGIDYEIYNAMKMRELHQMDVMDSADREHLIQYFYNQANRFDIRRINPPEKWVCPEHNFTVDTQEDYRWAQHLAESFPDIYFNVEDLIKVARL